MLEINTNGRTVEELREAYPFIQAMGEYMGSYPHYVEDQLYFAHHHNAPADATGCDRAGKVTRWGDIPRDQLRQELLTLVARRLTK